MLNSILHHREGQLHAGTAVSHLEGEEEEEEVSSQALCKLLCKVLSYVICSVICGRF